MKIDLNEYYKRYEGLVAAIDLVFNQIQKEYAQQVKCKVECSDCCHALFDLTLIEALYINHRFNQEYDNNTKQAIVEKANAADREVFRVKRQAAKAAQNGRSDEEILIELSGERIQCPLLNERSMCDLYTSRPITCRLYGIPTSIAGMGHTCGMSGFDQGQTYPTVKLDEIQNKLFALSAELAISIKSSYRDLGGMLMPLSRALLTEFDEAFMGMKGTDTDDPKAKNEE
jgi:Fe-S-cluster containining protein